MELPDLSAADDLLDELSVRIYEPPLNAVHSRIVDLATPLQTTVLFLNFDTELAINGITGFLENSSGAYLRLTIAAFDRIGAASTAERLRAIQRVLEAAGISHERLRADFEGRHEYEIVTFQELHGSEVSKVAEEIHRLTGDLYMYKTASEDPYDLMRRYVELHRDEIISEAEAAAN